MSESYFWKPFAQGVATPIVLIGGTNLLLKDFKVSNPYLYWGGLAASSAVVVGILANKIKVPILNAESDNCPICKGDIYGDMSMIGEEIVPDICGDCDIYVMPQGSDFKVRCMECGYGDIYGSRTPCEECESIADKMEAVNNRMNAETFESEGILCKDCPMAGRHVVIRKDHTDEDGNLMCPFCHSNKNFNNIPETTYLLHGGNREDLNAETFESEWVVEAVQQNLNDKDFVNDAYKVLIGGDAKTFEEKSMAIAETMNQNANNDDFTSFVESELFNTESFEAQGKPTWAGYCPFCKKWRTTEWSKKYGGDTVCAKGIPDPHYNSGEEALFGRENFARKGGKWIRPKENICGVVLEKKQSKNAEDFDNKSNPIKKYCIGCGTPRKLEKLPSQVGIDGTQAYSCGDCYDEVREAETFNAEKFKRRKIDAETRKKVGKAVADELADGFHDIMWAGLENGHPMTEKGFVDNVRVGCDKSWPLESDFREMRIVLEGDGYYDGWNDYDYEEPYTDEYLRKTMWPECKRQIIARAKRDAPEIVAEAKKEYGDKYNAETFEEKVYDPMMQKKIDQNGCEHRYDDGEDAWVMKYSELMGVEDGLSYIEAGVKCKICGQERIGSWAINEKEGFQITKGEEGRMPKMYGFYASETFEARTTRKGGRFNPNKNVRDGAYIYTHKKDGIPMNHDNQKVRKLNKVLRQQGVPLKTKTKKMNAETFEADTSKYFDEREELYGRQNFITFSNLGTMAYNSLYMAARELGATPIEAYNLCNSKWIRYNEDYIPENMTEMFMNMLYRNNGHKNYIDGDGDYQIADYSRNRLWNDMMFSAKTRIDLNKRLGYEAETFNSDSHTDSFMADMPVNAVRNEHGDGWTIDSVHRRDYKETFKNWKPSKYPYEKRITQDSVDETCNSCGKENVHYQFYLPRTNSVNPKIRFIDDATYCQYDPNTCGGNICGDCAQNNDSCENCGVEICSSCEEENNYEHSDLVCVDCREFNESLEDD